VGFGIRFLVQPFQGLPVLVPNGFGDPDDSPCIVPRCIGQELAKVVVIGGIELVLDDDRPVGPEVSMIGAMVPFHDRHNGATP